MYDKICREVPHKRERTIRRSSFSKRNQAELQIIRETQRADFAEEFQAIKINEPYRRGVNFPS